MPSRQSPESAKRQRYWLEHLVACGKGGQRLSEYAATHGLNLAQLYNWKTVLKRRGLLSGGPSKPSVRPRRSIRVRRQDLGGGRAPVHFAAVQVSGGAGPRPALRIRFPNGIIVETVVGADSAPVDRDLLSFLSGLLP